MLPKEQGLTSQEAEARLEQFGPNILPEKRPPNDFLIFLSQLKNPLVYVLIFAGVVTLILRHTSDTAIIGLAVLVNTVLGFFQERKAGRALVALKKLITAQAEVIRDGKRQKIEAQEIVPGDIAVLSSGMKIPADGKLVYANRLFIDEAVLTGESQPVAKKEEETIFMGTVVSSGQGAMEVGITGEKTQVGKIALEVQAEPEDTSNPCQRPDSFCFCHRHSKGREHS